MNLREQAISGVKWTSLSKAATMLLQCLQLAILARLLNPEDFGLMGMLMIVVGFAQAFSDMGISNAIVHHQEISREQLSSLYWLNVLGGVVLFVALLLSAPLIALLFKEPRLTQLLPWLGLTFLIIPIGQQFQVLMEKELQFARLARIEAFATVMSVSVAVSMAWLTGSVVALIGGALVSAGARALLLAISGWREHKPARVLHWRALKGFLGFGIFQMGERSINYLAWQLDKVFVGSLLGAQALGYYQVAYELMVRPFLVINPIVTRVAFPVFSKMQSDDERLKGGYLKLTSMLAAVLMPAYWGLVVVAEPLILLLLGPDWHPSVKVFQILCLLGFFYSVGNPLGTLLLAKGRADLGFYMNGLVLVLYGTAVWVGSHFGVTGIATALVTVTATALFPIGLWVRWLLIRLRPLDFLVAIGPFFCMGALMGGVVHAIQVSISWRGPVDEAMALTSLGVAVYATILFFWDRTFCRQTWLMLKSRG